jgi:teichuronic acid exporter
MPDDPTQSLGTRATNGILWSAFERFGQQGVSFLVQIVLARLLAPEQFGLIAMVAVFVALCQGIADAGFHEAIIQKKELDDSLVSTVFFTNLLLACFLTVVLWFGAPYVADFYHQERLTLLLRVLSVGLIIDGFARIQLTLLQRALLFRELATANLAASLLSGIVAVTLAFMGFGVWALIAQVLIQRSLVACMLWFQSDWRPVLSYSFVRLREILPFASRMFASNILNNVFQQIYVLIIGRVGSPVQLGYYQRANSFKRLASSASNTLMARITFPLFAQVQDDPARLRRGFIKACQLLAFTFFPFMAVLAAVGEPLIVTLIGEKWLPAVPYLQLLCIVGALHPVHAINLSLIKALGQGGLFLRLEIIKKCMIATVLFITFRQGVYAIVLGQVFCNILALGINAFYTRRLIDVSYGQQFRVFSGAIAVSLTIGYVVASWILPSLQLAAPFTLGIGVSASCVIWLFAIFLLRSVFADELKWFSGELSRLPFIKGRFL